MYSSTKRTMARQTTLLWVSLIHSFIPDIYIAPLQETYSEALSVQLWSKRHVLRSLQKEALETYTYNYYYYYYWYYFERNRDD